MEPGRPYTFHLANLVKPGSLFEEGCMPAVWSKQRLEACGKGWTREGSDVAYYPCHEGGRRLCISFDLTFAYEDDEVPLRVS